MRFTDLPSGWAERPITDPDIFEGVIDLVVTEQSRREGTVYLLLTHPDGRLAQPLMLHEVGHGTPSLEDAHGWRTLLRDLSEHGVGSLVIARARHGAPEATPDDDALFRVLLGGTEAAGLVVHARAIATPSGILTLGPPDAKELSRPA